MRQARTFLYSYDTREISRSAVGGYANGESRGLLNGGTTTTFTVHIFLANRELVTRTSPIAPQRSGLWCAVISALA